MESLELTRKLFAPPKLPDEEATRIASTVYEIGLTLIPIAAVAAVAVGLVLPDPFPRLVAAVAAIVVATVAMAVARLGHSLASARVLVAGTWACLALGLALTHYVSVALLSGFVLSIAAAGLLLGSRWAYAVAALSSLLAPICSIVIPDAATRVTSSQGIPAVTWMIQATIFIATAVLVSIATRQAEESRARALQSEARFRAIAEHAPDMISELDEQGRFVYANPAGLSGPVPVFIDGELGHWMHSGDRSSILEKFRSLVIDGSSTSASFRSIDPGGNIRWFETTAAAYLNAEGQKRVVAMTRDVTTQRRTESEHRESLERYRLLAEHAPDMILEFDSEGRVIYANPRALAILGIDLETYRSLQAGDRVHPDDLEECTRRFEEVVQHGRPMHMVHRIRRENEDYVWVSTSGARYTNAAGEFRVITQVRDLTEELSLQEQLRQSQKMDAIGRLAGGVAHDFNNLLTVIRGYAEVLEASLAPGDARSAAQEISDATERAAALTRQLLVLSRRQLSQPKVVDLNESIRGLEPILRGTLGERILLELTLAPDLPAIEIDPSQLEQVLLNLALNARDAMPEQGKLRIETGLGEGGRFVHLRVSDTGTGMDDATRARAFEPFFTTKPAGQGTGLGLSTTYGIVRQCGGSIALDSAPGSGTRVEIGFPASSSRPTTGSRLAASSDVTADGEATILLVEDDPSVRRLLAIMLESAGYRVRSASDASEALAIAASSPKSFDLLISDQVMPGQSGLELCNELRKRWPDLRVALMSGYAELPDSASAGLPRGAELLAKPFTRDQLQRLVARLVRKA